VTFRWELRTQVVDDAGGTPVMGILNVTPDSFSDGGRYLDPAAAVARGRRLVADGAAIVDVGGESTRPGAQPVTVEEELRRVQPVISELRRRTGILISIDTRKAEVAEKAIELGADVVNDVSGLVSDPRIVPIVAREGAGLVLMHMKGTPEHMQDTPAYRDVVREVKAFLRSAIQRAEAGGVMPDSILVDPGIGFGKTGVHNLQILNRLELFASLEKPILIGTSRKSFIGRVLGIHSPEARLYGTAATVAASVMRGAHVVRVHDVPEMIQVARSVDAILNEALDTASRSAPIEVSE